MALRAGAVQTGVGHQHSPEPVRRELSLGDQRRGARLEPPPPGVDYTFWEENYSVLADGRATFAWIAAPTAPVIAVESDLSALEDVMLAY